jgi:hypothetical protein
VIDTYWSEYARSRYGDPTQVVTRATQVDPAATRRLILDYAFDRDKRVFVGLAISASGQREGDAGGKQLVVFAEGPGDATVFSGLVLSYQEQNGQITRKPLSAADVTHEVDGVQVMMFPAAGVRSARLSNETPGKPVQVLCSVSFSSGDGGRLVAVR